MVEGGQSIAAATKALGVTDWTLFNWAKAYRLAAHLQRACGSRHPGGQGSQQHGIRANGRRRLKVERLRSQRLTTRRQVKDEVVAWSLWYNRTRLHSTLAYFSPMSFEEN